MTSRTTIDAMSTDTTPTAATRIERDSMGEMGVPADALYGASTQRAVLDFPISGQRMPRRFLRALALVKLAAAKTNRDLGLLDAAKAQAIAAAARDVAEGGYDEHFPRSTYTRRVEGTSTNTNMNEVISHLAWARLGGVEGPPQRRRQQVPEQQRHDPHRTPALGRRGHRRRADPGPHRPPAGARGEGGRVLGRRQDRSHPSPGRDADPARPGVGRLHQGQVEEAIRRAQAARDELLVVPLGGTAVGTGINAHPEYAARACGHLGGLTGILVREAPNHFHAQATLDAAIAAHGGMRAIALGLWKIGSDIRFMGMGPRAGIAELALPETQPGSSIMPGKVNPVIVESLTMVVARVVGNDATVAFGRTGSFLELNVMMPVTSQALLESIVLLAASARNFRVKLVEGLKATERGPALVEQGLMLATALAPEIGYDAAAAMAKEGFKSGRTIREMALEKGIAPERLDELLDPLKMTEPGLGGGGGGG